MKDKFLQEIYKYDKESDTYHVVIDLDTYRDAYSDWDYSPLVNRDLDDDLQQYLMECSEEIGLKRKMAVDFYIPEDIVNAEREKKSKQGFHHYFLYRIRKIKSERGRAIRKTVALLLIGILFLAIANLIRHFIPSDFVYNIVSEGLSIGAWVALWEIFNELFFNISVQNRRINNYKRLQEIPIIYNIKQKQ